MRIRNICIVGGGSAGWMTAAALTQVLPNIDVTLIESKNISTVGVGESTLTYINSFLRMLGLQDEDWMSYCNATYKTSIKFTDFATNKFQTKFTFFRKIEVLEHEEGKLQEYKKTSNLFKNINFKINYRKITLNYLKKLAIVNKINSI